MPTQADITVKKNDGTTDITYTKVQASGGDKSPAIWRSNSVGTAAAHRPEFRTVSHANGDGSARRVLAQFSYPVTATGSDGKVYVVRRLNMELSCANPLDMADTDMNEAVSQGCNLMGSTHVKDQIKAGFAST
jgi:hypothetical protein